MARISQSLKNYLLGDLERPASPLFTFVFAFAFCSVIWGHRNFVHLRLGPLPILECLALLLILLFLLTLPFRSLIRSIWDFVQLQPFLFAFFGLSSLLLFADLVFLLQAHPYYPLQRTLQHFLLVAYPVIWGSLGYLFARFHSSSSRWVLFIAFLSSLFAGPFRLPPNISVGPLLSMACVGWVSREWSKKKHQRNTPLLVVAILLGSAPFFKMWTDGYVQRTTWGTFLVMLVTLPLLMRVRKGMKRGGSLLPLLKHTSKVVFSFLIPILLFGLIFSVSQSHFTSKSTSLLDGFIHEEDRLPDDPQAEFETLRGRFRRYCWYRTLKDWQRAPLTGVGFITEIPSWVTYYDPNIGGLEGPGSPPVSGPHNSYLTILARTGPLGLILFLGVLVFWVRAVSASALGSPLSLVRLLEIIFPLAAFLYATVNVGFESPQNCFIGWAVFGIFYGNRSPLTSSAKTPIRP